MHHCLNKFTSQPLSFGGQGKSEIFKDFLYYDAPEKNLSRLNFSLEVLVRFEHLFDVHDDEDGMSVPVSFDLTSDFFRGFTIDSAQEMFLGGDRTKEKFAKQVRKF